MGGEAAAVVSGSTLSGAGSGSAIQQLQQQQQQMFLQAAALSGSFNALQAPGMSAAAVATPDFAAAADVYMTGSAQAAALSAFSLDRPAAAAGVLPPAAAGVLGSTCSQDGVGLAGSNSSMMRPGSYVKSELSDPAAAAGMQGGSFAAPALAPGQQPQAAAAAAATCNQDQQQQQVGSRKSGKTGQKLMRSIAAAVNTLVRPGRRTNTPTAAAAAGQSSDLVTRSMSALPAGYTSATAVAAAAPASFTAGGSGSASLFQQDPTASARSSAAAAALLAQQQALLLNSTMYTAGYTTKQQYQSQELLGQLLSAFDGEPSGMACRGISQPGGSYSAVSGMSNPPQMQAKDDNDAIITAAQQLLHRKHQQRVSGPASGSTGSGSVPPAAASAGQLGGGQAGGSSRQPSTAATAMDTTPIWPGQGSPCLPQQQQQQQAQGVFGLEQMSQPLAAAVLPLDFQATYTDGCLLDDDDLNVDDAMLDDMVMQLARQEGVLVNGQDPNVQSFF
jgi:hypothetical protein